MNSQQTFEWQFGGGSGFPPWLGWTLLFSAAAVGVLLATWLYRETLQTLSLRQRIVFILLRSGFFLALLICLAGPSSVERTFETVQSQRPLAVIVDRSASMTVPDSAGLSRLTAAVRTWKQSESAAIHSFPNLRYFRFSTQLSPASDLDQAVEQPDPGASTALFTSLAQVLQSAPPGGYGGIVCLTDGLDTTPASEDQLVSAAVQSRTPVYFVVGQNRQAIQEDLIVRETTTPEKVVRKTEFNATALIEAHSARERDVPLALVQDGRTLDQTTLHLRAGRNLLPWVVPVHADEPGLIHLDWHLGDGPDAETVSATVPVVAKDKVSVLFYQGTLDWGFHFIHTALQRDASFSVTALFNPDLSIEPAQSTNPPDAASADPVPTDLPDNASALAPYQIVVLANAYADQMSADQQKALTDYVRHGGGLLFLVSDGNMAQTFSGTPLEAMLPVVFEPPPPSDQDDSALADFQENMHEVGGVQFEGESDFARTAQNQPPPPSLKTFALPAHASRQKIAQLFDSSAGGTVPKFANYAPVASLKAGAEALAVHPDDTTPDNGPRILLATQRFGQGQVTALLTDALWRWKLSLPASSHAPETFWQQLFLALVSPPGNMHFSRQPYSASLGEQTTFAIDGVPDLKGPTVTAISPASVSAVLPSEPGSHPGEWTSQLTTNQPGKWRVQASDSGGAQVETLVRVLTTPHKEELSGLPPDVEGMQRLANLTGGAILNDGTPDAWSGHAVEPDLTMLSEHVRPLWNTWGLLLLALTFYAVELIWRRRAKLL